MFSYQRKLNLPTEAITRDVFWGLIRDPRHTALIDGFRETGDAKKKRSLPAFLFQATFDETTSEKGVTARWRVQSAARLTGLVVMDIDHVENPRDQWEKMRTLSNYPPSQAPQSLTPDLRLPLKGGREDETKNDSTPRPLRERLGEGLGILLVYITPSGKGLKIVFKARVEWGNLIDNQFQMAKLLGVKVDESCKDASRMSFICKESDILYINEDELFSYENKEFAERYEEAYRQGQSKATRTLSPEPDLRRELPNADARLALPLKGEGETSPQDTSSLPLREGPREGLPLYHGVEYSKIIEAWLGGKTVEPGDRHRTSLHLADHLRYITDNDAKLIERILRHTPFVEEIIQERNEPIAQTIKDAQGYKMYKSIPRRMQNALAVAGAVKEEEDAKLPLGEAPSDDIYNSLPFDAWGKELQEMSKEYPCMKELFRNLHPHKLPAVLFSTAAMFGTLMTRTWYRFWFDPEAERRLNYCIFIIGDPGAGKNVIEKFYNILVEPITVADQSGIDAVNRYKDGRTERSTSTKAQKGDALKKPVVGIRVHPARTSTGEFIRHMLAAVEDVEGKKLNLHMFSFDSELDNVTKNNKGGDWKDREVMELKAFHNEKDGQMYANQESITGMFNIFWNFIYTGTPYALNRKVNQRNFGTGMSTRLAVIPMPDEGMAERYQKFDPKDNERLKEWAYRLDKVEGELPIEPLNDVTYEWQEGKMEIADFNVDKAERSILKRIPYYGIGISLPFILMRHWKEWTQSKTLTMDETDKRLCLLAMDIQYRTQQFFFGEMAHRYYEDQNKTYEPVRRTSRYQVCYSKLPDEFGIDEFMTVFHCSKPAAKKSIQRFIKGKVVEHAKPKVYKKILKSLSN